MGKRHRKIDADLVNHEESPKKKRKKIKEEEIECNGIEEEQDGIFWLVRKPSTMDCSDLNAMNIIFPKTKHLPSSVVELDEKSFDCVWSNPRKPMLRIPIDVTENKETTRILTADGKISGVLHLLDGERDAKAAIEDVASMQLQFESIRKNPQIAPDNIRLHQRWKNYGVKWVQKRESKRKKKKRKDKIKIEVD